ncbi:MAG: ComEC/Rec2 family competence protein [Planctomycetota bacterium]|nr:ComEC/Rec2 family competence protein [Planctomycetota bacterium]
MQPVQVHAPLGVPALGLSAGALLGAAVSPALASAGAALVLGGSVLARRARVPLLALAAGLLAAAAARGTAQSRPWQRAMSAGLYALEGTVREAPPPRRFSREIRLDVARVGEGDAAVSVRLPARLRASLPTLPSEACVPGARVRVIARIERPRSVRASLRGTIPAREGVVLLAEAPPLRQALAAARNHTAGVFDRHLPYRDAGLARAIVAGDRTRLTWSDRARFQQADQVHLLAVSGMHVALVIGGFVAVLRILGMPLVPTHLMALAAIAFYVPFTGASASSLRAGFGAAIYLVAPLLGRPTTGLAVIPPVVVLTFAFDATAFSRLGLWLSLSAVLGILVLTPPLTAAFVRRPLELQGLRAPSPAWVRRGLAMGFGAWCGTLPIVAGEIGRVCLVAAPLSIVAAPFLAVLIGSAIVLLAVGEVGPLADAVAAVFEHTADALRLVLDLPRMLGLDAARVAPPRLGWHVAYLLSLVGIVRAPTRRRIAWLALALVLAGLLTLDDAPHRGSRSTGYDAPPPAPAATAPEESMDGLTLLAAASGLLVFAFVSVRPGRFLTPAGAAGAWVLGTATAWRFGWTALIALLVTFLVTTGLSKLPGRERSGPRSLRQVVANGAGPMAGCVMSILGFPYAGGGAFIGGLAFLGADTVSSELGKRYGGPPRRLLSSERIAPGQSGGVTALGSVAGAAGALLPALVFCLVEEFMITALLWMGLAGLLAAIFDSLLGDTVQYRGLSPDTGSITEVTEVNGVETEHMSGYRWLDNDTVNLISGLVGALLGALFIYLV